MANRREALDVKWKECLEDPRFPCAIDLCEQWLLLHAHHGSRGCRVGSYTMKHWVEQWAGEYIREAAFVCAALSLGYAADDAGRWNMRFGRLTQPLLFGTLQYTGIKGMPIL